MSQPRTPDPTSFAAPGAAVVTESLLAKALETVSEGSLITDADRKTIYSNTAFTDITGYGADEIVGTNCRVLQGPETSPDDVQRIRDALNAGEVFQGTILNYRKDGSTFWNHLTITPLLNDAGDVTNFVSVQRDVTDIVEERERLSYDASHDPLTGLPNRDGTRRLVRRALAQAAERGDVVAIGLFDLDHFKDINDTHGHPAGDAVLVELGRRVRTVLRRNDHVTRVGGDEFVVILADLDPIRALSQLDEIAHRMRTEIVRPFVLDNGTTITLTTSMGVAFYPADGLDIDALYAAADQGLYVAKERRGGDDWWSPASPTSFTTVDDTEVSEPSSGSVATQPTSWAPSQHGPMAGAPAHHTQGTLTMFMQPIVDLTTGTVTQFEALARIRRPDGSLMLPDEFLPSYTTDHLRELFWIGIHQSLEWVAKWQALGLDLSVSVNVPPIIFATPDSVQLVTDALELRGVEPSRLSLELLETHDVELAVSTDAIDELMRLGVKLHLDDISSGYSTLKRITELPFDVIKIDRQIFDNVHSRALHVITVLAAITKLGRDFGYGVTVEGIENRERLEVSTALGAHFGQGYLLAAPMPAEDVAEWVPRFTLPVEQGAVTTALGALAFHWNHSRRDGPVHPPLASCPLTSYFSDNDVEGAELHKRSHAGGAESVAAGMSLTSLLLDIVKKQR